MSEKHVELSRLFILVFMCRMNIYELRHHLSKRGGTALQNNTLTNRLKVIYVEQPVLRALTQASYMQISDDFLEDDLSFFCFCLFKLHADPVQKVFTAAKLPANTCLSLYVRLSASQVHSAFFLRETVGGNNRAFMSHRGTFVADLKRFFFHDFTFQGTAEQMNTIILCQQGTCPHMSEMTTACTSLSDRITPPNMQLLLSIVALTFSFTIYRLCFVSCRVHWVPTV